MPTLEELYRAEQAKYAKSIGIGHTLTQVGGSPSNFGSFLKGGTWNAGGAILKGLWGQVANAVQSASPVAIPGATDPLLPAGDIGGRFQRFTNAVFMNILDNYNREKTADIAEWGTPRTFEEKTMTTLRSLATTGLKDYLPGRELMGIVKGQDEAGTPLTSEQVGENVTMGLLKVVPMGWLKNKMGVKGLLERIKKEATHVGRDVMTGGEIRAWRNKMGIDRDAPVTLSPDATPEQIAYQNIDQAVRRQLTPQEELVRPIVENLSEGLAENEIFARGMLSEPAFQRAYAQAISGDVFRNLFTEGRIKKGALNYEVATEAIRNGALDVPFMEKIVRAATDDLVPHNQLPGMVADIFARSSSNFGKSLKVLSDATLASIADLTLRAAEGDAVAAKAIASLEMNARMGKQTGLSFLQKASNVVRELERVRRGLMVGRFATHSRNAAVQFAVNGPLELFEQLVADTVEGLTGKAKGFIEETTAEGARTIRPPKKLMDLYSQSLYNWARTIGTTFTKEGHAALNTVMTELPMVAKRIQTGSAFDLGMATIIDVLRHKVDMPSNALGWADVLANTFNITNRLQEVEFRRWAFAKQLSDRSARLGIKDWDGIVAELKKSTPREGFHEAIAASVDHALKQTFAYVPEGGAGRAILNFYQKFPIATAIFPPFPRFLINMWRWQMERNPLNILNLFNKDFRKVLTDGIDNGFQSAIAARHVANGISGLFMLNAAWILRNSEDAGPKYFLLRNPAPGMNTPNEEGDPMIDIRPFQPFATYAFLGEVMKSVQTNQPLNITPNEFADAIAGIRRLGEVPGLAILDIMRSLGSNDPETVMRTIKTPIGQWMGSFFTPMHFFRGTGGGFIDEWSEFKDVSDQELTGPARQTFPANDLPPRYDLTTGRPLKTDNPLLHSLVGLPTVRANNMRQLLLSTPGLDLNSLAGQWDSQEANSLVVRNMGVILGHKLTPDGKTVGDVLAQRIRAMRLTPASQRELITSLFAELREVAKTHAQQTNPTAFLEHELNKLPPDMKGVAKRFLVERGIM